MDVDRFTEEENEAYYGLRNYFGPDLYRFVVVVFTHADKFDEKNNKVDRETALMGSIKELEEKTKKVNESHFNKKKKPSIQAILDEVGGGYVVLSNTDGEAEKRIHVQKLLHAIKVMQSKNFLTHFSDEKTAEATKLKENRLAQIMQEKRISRTDAFKELSRTDAFEQVVREAAKSVPYREEPEPQAGAPRKRPSKQRCIIQ
jgi:hypothetical protein